MTAIKFSKFGDIEAAAVSDGVLHASYDPFRNIERVSVLAATDAGVADVVGAASLVVSSAALERLEQNALESKASS